jgi:hypothetical protein
LRQRALVPSPDVYRELVRDPGLTEPSALTACPLLLRNKCIDSAPPLASFFGFKSLGLAVDFFADFADFVAGMTAAWQNRQTRQG